jgi:hypothetical protein
LGAPVTLRVTDEAAHVVWDLGDGTARVGKVVTHRYRERGARRVCALVLDHSGRVEMARRDLDILTEHTTNSGIGRLSLVALVGVLLAVLLLLLVKGNIVTKAGRSHRGVEGR